MRNGETPMWMSITYANACTQDACVVEYGCRQSPRLLIPGGRRGFIGAGLGATRPAVVQPYSFSTSSRLPSDLLSSRLRRSLSQTSSKSSAQLGAADATMAKISSSIRQAPPFVGAARIGPCRRVHCITKHVHLYYFTRKRQQAPPAPAGARHRPCRRLRSTRGPAGWNGCFPRMAVIFSDLLTILRFWAASLLTFPIY